MSPASPSRESVAPLLLELARALRARQFYPTTHPAMRDALERVSSMWAAALSGGREIDLGFRQAGFVLPGGAELRGPGIDDLAGVLLVRRVRRLRMLPGLDRREIAALLETLVIEPDALANLGGFEQALRDAGVQHVSTVDPKLEDEPSVAGAIGDTYAQVQAHVPELPEAERSDSAPRRMHTDDTVVLVRQLAELEVCDEPHAYGEFSDDIGSTVASLMRSDDRVDAYRAVLVYCRHAEHGERGNAIRREARERLCALTRDPALLDFVMQQACGTSGLSSVQAIQVLACIGPAVAPHLLRRLNDSDSSAHGQTTAVLIALGEHALPAVVDELSATEPERARRAARLLGEMQNPRGVEFLLAGLRSRDGRIRREVARALARIGDERAIRGLTDALSSLDTDLALSAAAALGSSRGPRVLAALVATLDETRNLEEEVRLESIRSLGRLANPGALLALERVLQQGSLLQRKRYRQRQTLAAQAIARIGGSSARRLLARHAEQGSAELRRICEGALARIAGQPTGT